ncbi:MAG TPA: hypothetical protein VMD97_06135 [Candidatus Aquilonibacter sp.]|nr:hypothetical protein [Candidatus Aquilonibacter sp.]
MTPATLRALSATEAATLPPLLHALWHDAHGDWARALSIAQDLDTPAAARVHAYLHRKQGDHFNASYWDRSAARLDSDASLTTPPIPTGSLDGEWTALATHLLA